MRLLAPVATEPGERGRVGWGEGWYQIHLDRQTQTARILINATHLHGTDSHVWASGRPELILSGMYSVCLCERPATITPRRNVWDRLLRLPRKRRALIFVLCPVRSQPMLTLVSLLASEWISRGELVRSGSITWNLQDPEQVPTHVDLMSVTAMRCQTEAFFPPLIVMATEQTPPAEKKTTELLNRCLGGFCSFKGHIWMLNLKWFPLWALFWLEPRRLVDKSIERER